MSSLPKKLTHLFRSAAMACVVWHCAGADTSWHWLRFDYENDVWLRTYKNGEAQFDFKLGGGGAVAEMRFCPERYKALLANPYGGNQTDRVLQWTLWSDTFSDKTQDAFFNEDLAGSNDGLFSPTLSVENSANKTDVYSRPQDQWDRNLNAGMQATYPTLTRYEMQDSGVLKVRRIVLIGAVSNSSNRPYNVYFEQWNPFKVGTDTFDSVALHLATDTGEADWWYRSGFNVPYYDFLPAGESFGYAVAYRDQSLSSAPVVGIVFGAKAVRWVGYAAGAKVGRHVLNLMDWGTETPWDQGVAILPAIQLLDVEPGSLLDYTFYIVARARGDGELRTLLSDLATKASAPTVYAPGAAMDEALKAISTRLASQAASPGVRTNHLAPLEIAEPESVPQQ